MATDQRRHFADPLHLLLKTQYNRTATHVCDICQAKLAGMVGYRCNACNVDIHEACADCFKETISLFAHTWHTLTLSRMPDNCIGWSCNHCREGCHPGWFTYRCIQCNFVVHPRCTMPQYPSCGGASSQTTSSSQTTADRPSRSTQVAKFILKTVATQVLGEAMD